MWSIHVPYFCFMKSPILIAGGGLSGCCLALELHRLEVPFLLCDPILPGSATAVGAGSFHPLIPKRKTVAWQHQQWFHRIEPFYRYAEEVTNASFFQWRPGLFIFEDAADRNDWQGWKSDNSSLEGLTFVDEVDQAQGFKVPYGAMACQQSGWLNMPVFRDSVHQWLRRSNRFISSAILPEEVVVQNHQVVWQGITADKVIFCDGFRLAENPWFKFLPHQYIHGDAMKVRIPGLSATHIYHRGIYLIPQKDDYWYLGASFLKDDRTTAVSDEGINQLLHQARQFISAPIEVIEQYAGVRTASADRQPLCGPHPEFDRLWLINGLGTRGVGYMPWVAEEVAHAIISGNELPNDLSLNRFKIYREMRKAAIRNNSKRQK